MSEKEFLFLFFFFSSLGSSFFDLVGEGGGGQIW